MSTEYTPTPTDVEAIYIEARSYDEHGRGVTSAVAQGEFRRMLATVRPNPADTPQVEAAELALALHQRSALGMTYGSADRCRCGAQIMPASGHDEISIRRDRALAAHQARAVLTALAEAVNRG